MKYIISTEVYGSPGYIEISESRYHLISDSQKYLLETLFLEEKLDYVMENYYELEIELVSIASRMMIFHNLDHFSMTKDRNTISRRIANLMSSCRMYLDQSIHHLINIYGKKSKKY